MALTDENGVGTTMLVQPSGYGMPYGGGFGGGLFGGNGGNDWLGLLFLIALCNGGWGFGGFGGGWGMGMMGMGMMGMDYLYPWLNNSQHISDGFRDQQLNTQVGNLQNAVTSGFGDVALGIAGVNQNLCQTGNGIVSAVNGAQNAISQQMYANQLADLERSFAAQSATTGGLTNLSAQLANCCCENRAATQDVKYTIATEACNTRAANTANTQAILDKLCALELDGYKRENDQLRTQLNMANLAASQTAQTAELRTNTATVANQLVAELRSCPIPAQPVYGNQPIFTCAQNVANSGCGCGFANG